MEAMDILLQACHAQTTLNLFVESFLRMVQKLLEDSNPNLQILATNSVSFLSFFFFLSIIRLNHLPISINLIIKLVFAYCSIGCMLWLIA